jgi:uncharacterized protein YecE (DUF72 family)
MKVHVGCCGWPRGRKDYFRVFSTVELQSTFYRLPEPETAERWAKEAPEGFIFCLKAWQAITHPVTSPTWKRSGMSAEELKRREYGWLRPTEDNFRAWEMTRAICEKLSARICVIQTPPSFGFSVENAEGMMKFLGKIDRRGVLLAWEPRGIWTENPEEVRKMCRKLDMIHTVDPLRSDPVHLGSKKIAYFRLHGFGKPSIYNYKFSDGELRQVLEKAEGTGAREVFCMFNNIHMFEDAKRFKRMVERNR